MAKSMFYGFLLRMWTLGKLNEDEIASYVPKFISEEEKKQIIETPKKNNE